MKEEYKILRCKALRMMILLYRAFAFLAVTDIDTREMKARLKLKDFLTDYTKRANMRVKIV